MLKTFIWLSLVTGILITPPAAWGAGNTFEVSAVSQGPEGNQASGSPSISDDSTTIAFQSSASNFISGDSNEVSDIYVLVHDIFAPGKTVQGSTKTFSRVSVSSDGIEANGPSTSPSLSTDSGRFVAFASTATNLVSADSNSKQDIFVRDRQLGTTTRISVPLDQNGNPVGEADGDSYDPHISSDGCFVVFSSDATNLEALGSNGLPLTDTNGKRDIFLYYNPAGQDGCDGDHAYLEFISLGPNDGLADGDSSHPHFGSRRYISFTSEANNLVSGDTNGVSDIFVRDRAVALGDQVVNRVTVLVSESSNGEIANGASYHSSIDGSVIAYDSDATNLVADDTNGKRDIFIHRLDGQRGLGTTTRESVSNTGEQSDGDSFSPSLARGANYLAFASDATNLSERTDCNGATDIFVYDSPYSTLRRTSLTVAGYQSEFGKNSVNPVIAGGGFLVVYESEGVLVPQSSDNAIVDIFASQASADPSQALDPLRSDTTLTESPDVCVNGRSLEIFLEAFNGAASQSSAMRLFQSKTKSRSCKPESGQVCYDVQIISKGKNRDVRQKTSKNNSVTVSRLKSGTYSVSFRARGRTDTGTVSTNRSPIRRVTIPPRA